MLSHDQITGLSLKQLQTRHKRNLTEALAPLGVTVVQWNALRQIHRFPDASLHFLAEQSFQSDQAFGAVTSRMVTGGLLVRVAGPGKVVRHRLTEEGERLLHQGDDVVDAVFAESFSSLSPDERAEFDRLLAKVLEHNMPELAGQALHHRMG